MTAENPAVDMNDIPRHHRLRGEALDDVIEPLITQHQADLLAASGG